MKIEGKIGLIGGGYVLERFANCLQGNNFVITSRSLEKVSFFKQQGYQAEVLDLADSVSVDKFFLKHSDINFIIDSVPPIKQELEQIEFKSWVLELKKLSNLKKIFYLSTTGVYGEVDANWVDESRGCFPVSSAALARVACENIYRESFLGQVVFLRISAIYGPKRGIGLSLKNGKFPFIENGVRWSNRIHVDDIVGVLQKLLLISEHSGLAYNIYNLSDTLPSQTKEVVEFYCKKFNLAFPKSISSTEALLQGFHTLMSNQKVSSQRLIEDLGYVFKYPSYILGAGSEFEI